MTDKALRAGDYLGHMLDATAQIHTYTAGLDETSFRASRLLQDAVVRNIEILGEAARNILKHCPELAREHDDIPWQDIYGMRNRLSHGYFVVGGLDLRVFRKVSALTMGQAIWPERLSKSRSPLTI